MRSSGTRNRARTASEGFPARRFATARSILSPTMTSFFSSQNPAGGNLHALEDTCITPCTDKHIRSRLVAVVLQIVPGQVPRLVAPGQDAALPNSDTSNLNATTTLSTRLWHEAQLTIRLKSQWAPQNVR